MDSEEGAPANNFGIRIEGLSLSRFVGVDESLHGSVDAQAVLSLFPAAVDAEVQLAVHNLEANHLYHSSACPIGVPEPRPELLVSCGMAEGPAVENRLAGALVVAGTQAVTFEAPKQHFLNWRRWTELHSGAVILGADSAVPVDSASLATQGGSDVNIDDVASPAADGLAPPMAGSPVGSPPAFAQKSAVVFTIPPRSNKPSIQSLRPVSLPDLVNIHQPFVPVFQPSIVDDHFFVLAIAAAVSQDRYLLERVFASTEFAEQGLLVLRLLSEKRMEFPYSEGKTGPNLKGAARRKQTLTRSLNASIVSAKVESSEDVPAKATCVVTMPSYIVVDTMVPVSKATEDTIAPAELDLAIGRTYDAVNEFWVAFLAKGFAALHGSYSALHGGSAVEVLRTLMPGDPCYVRWNDKLFQEHYVLEALKRHDTQVPDVSYAATGAEAIRIAAARKNRDEIWWLLKEATSASQPMLLTNTNLCADPALDSHCSFGNVPSPITDAEVHLERWQKFNWSYGVAVLAAVEIDTSMAISDPYLRAIRRRNKRDISEVRRLVKVRSAYRTRVPEYAKLRGEWSLPNGGGRDVADEGAEAHGKSANGDITFTEEEEHRSVNGGNEHWSPFAQEALQYNVQEAIAKQSEDVVWWMTVEEVCTHFNCFATLFNTSGSGTEPPVTIVDAAVAQAQAREAEKRKPKDPFKVPEKDTDVDTKVSTPGAMLALLRAAAQDNSTQVASDTITRMVGMVASPSPSHACPNFPHFLLSVEKVDMGGGLGGALVLPDGADIRYKTIFDVKPNVLDLGEETDDDQESKGMSGTATSRTGSAIDVTVTPQNSLQLEICLSMPRTALQGKPFTVQLYRVTGPFKQTCVKSVREGHTALIFPVNTKVVVNPIGNVTEGGTDALSFQGSFSEPSTTVQKTLVFECEVNTGHYNVVVVPDCPLSSMYVQDPSLVQVSVTKRLNGDNFSVSLSPL